MYNFFNPNEIDLTKYIFFTGKGGVGKTSTACATAIAFVDDGKKVMLVSTDPASNLQDVFSMDIDNKGKKINEVTGLTVANFNPEDAAREYRESVIEPYRGKLPDAILTHMEEQLSGSCTVEIAAFNEFTNFITDAKVSSQYDHIIFDTAPTGHTLRMLQLPSAWSNFISQSTHGASCLGQLSGLQDKKDIYSDAVSVLSNPDLTTLILVTRPEESPLHETKRASKELAAIGITNQILIINGVFESFDDDLSKKYFNKQQTALQNMPEYIKELKSFYIPLRPYNITGIDNLRSMFTDSHIPTNEDQLLDATINNLNDIIEDLYNTDKKVIFTMGKGGVGKTTIAATVALGLSKKGKKVHLTTTDPANHLKFVIQESDGISISSIDEQEELIKYQQEVLSKARETMNESDIAYIEEDLRSPCTREIAVFRAFASIIKRSDDEVVVIDTAPTGHTLLLLDSTLSYQHEIKRSQGDIPDSVKELLPKLRNEDTTQVIIVTLPEATPVYEATRLENDLTRAGIKSKWWVVNSSLYATNTTNILLKTKANQEVKWINKVNEISHGNLALIGLKMNEIKENTLLDLLQ